MTKFFLRWLINAVGLYVAILIVPGIEFGGNWINLLWLALIFGLLNALLRPLLGLLTCPLIILTLGLFTLVLNTFMLWLTSRIGESFNLGLTVNGFWPAFLGALVMSLVSIVLSLVLRDEMKGRRR
jgi:putative membrane protein